MESKYVKTKETHNAPPTHLIPHHRHNSHIRTAHTNTSNHYARSARRGAHQEVTQEGVMPTAVCHASASRGAGQAQASSLNKNHVTSKSPVGDISVVTLIRTDTTLDHSQKAEKVYRTSAQKRYSTIAHSSAGLFLRVIGGCGGRSCVCVKSVRKRLLRKRNCGLLLGWVKISHLGHF